MAQRKDLTGQRFGRLVIQAMDWSGRDSRAICRCDCSRALTVRVSSLRNGLTKSCGCLRKSMDGTDPYYGSPRKDLTGQRFERLVVEAMEWKKGIGWATCRCDCGQYNRVAASSLLRQDPAKSCGCLNRRTPAEHAARIRLKNHVRRAKRHELPNTFGRVHEVFLREYWGSGCAICGALEDFWHCIAWDHWIPLSDPTSPGNVPGNILPLCHSRKGAGTLPGPRACNNSKGKKDPVVWIIARLGSRKANAKLRAIERYFAAATAFATAQEAA